MSGDSVLRAAIIGCGQIAGGYDDPITSDEIRTHAKAYWLNHSTILVAVAGRNIQDTREFCERWGNPVAYVDVSEMLSDEAPDIVSICTPDDTHAEMLELCLNCSSIKAIWCEKPLAIDVGRAERIVASYKKRGIVLAVNYQRRWDAQMESIRSALQQGELGFIQKVVVYYSKGIFHNGSHAVDLLLDWFGPPGEIQVLGSHSDFVVDDPTVDARLQLGDVPVYLIGADEREYSIFEIHILGTLGRVNVKNFGRETEWFQRETDPSPDGYRELMSEGVVYKTNITMAMPHALQEIIDAIFTGKQVRSNGELALCTLRVCYELAARARRKQ